MVGFKAFMSNSGIDDFPRVDDLALYERDGEAARLGCRWRCTPRATRSPPASRPAPGRRRTAIRDYLRSRPAVAELEAIARALRWPRTTGCALHVVHVSTGGGVALVAEARARGSDVSCETCPHYLALDEDDAERLGAVAKCAPPLRPRAECEALWHGARGRRRRASWPRTTRRRPPS